MTVSRRKDFSHRSTSREGRLKQLGDETRGSREVTASLDAEAGFSGRSGPPNSDLLLPYLLPYGAYVAIASLAGGLGNTADYILRIVIAGGLLLYLRKRFQPIRGPRPIGGSILAGVVAGLLGVLIWIGLLLPFQDPTEGEAFAAGAFALRLFAATLIVPFAEELLFRGYLLAGLTQWEGARRAGDKDPIGVTLDRRSVHDIEPGAWTPLAIILSSVAFAAGHALVAWPAAIAYGALMAGLWVVRKDLVAPIIAHAMTNLVLYVYVFQTGSWGLW